MGVHSQLVRIAAAAIKTLGRTSITFTDVVGWRPEAECPSCLRLISSGSVLCMKCRVPGGLRRDRAVESPHNIDHVVEVAPVVATFVPTVDSLEEICRLDVPLMKKVPKSVAAAFARLWGSLLLDASFTGSVGAWFKFFAFPKAILLAPSRGGSRLSKKQSWADLVRSRLGVWEDGGGWLHFGRGCVVWG